jgi:hypothetical protein
MATAPRLAKEGRIYGAGGARAPLGGLAREGAGRGPHWSRGRWVAVGGEEIRRRQISPRVRRVWSSLAAPSIRLPLDKQAACLELRHVDAR